MEKPVCTGVKMSGSVKPAYKKWTDSGVGGNIVWPQDKFDQHPWEFDG